jgi:hypothetical protein
LSEKARFSNLTQEVMQRSHYIKDMENRFAEELRRAQETILREIRLHRAELEQKQSRAKKEQQAKEYQIGEPDWNNLDLKHRDAFKNLSKAVARYVEGLNKGKKYEKLLAEKDDAPLLPERLHGVLKEKLLVMYSKLSPKEKQKWKAPFKDNNMLRKTSEWIGKEAAESFFQQLPS